MGEGKLVIIGLLIISVVLCGETSEIEEQLDTCVCNEVNLHQSHSSSELSCEGPEKPLNGGYVSDVIRERYGTGDTITYHCNTGHQLIGQMNRTCNGTSKQWEPQEPYCQPEYIGDLMRRLIDIEDKVSGIENKVSGIENQMHKLDSIEAELKVQIKQSIASSENNTLQTGCNISVMDNRMSTIDHKMDNRASAMENNVSAIYNISVMEPLNFQIDRERLAACTNITKAIDEDTVTKCTTMQLGVRNGHRVSVYTWIIEDINSKILEAGIYHSQPFYNSVPGYKFRLHGSLWSSSDTYFYLQVLPGEYDDQLKWPFYLKHEVTILTNDGTEVIHRSSSGDQSLCQLDRSTSPIFFGYKCYTFGSNWDDAWKNKKHILPNDTLVAKLYLYN